VGPIAEKLAYRFRAHVASPRKKVRVCTVRRPRVVRTRTVSATGGAESHSLWGRGQAELRRAAWRIR